MAVQRKRLQKVRQGTPEPTELAELYERDYYGWTDAQVQALRKHNGPGLDWDNLAEEVEDLGRAERHRLESHLEGLLMHLLKWAHEPQRRSRSWKNSVREHRFRIQRVLRDNPSLKAKLPEIFTDAYEAARYSAEAETGLDLSIFEESCPWRVEDVLNSQFWPEAASERKRRPSRKPTTVNRQAND